MSVRVTGLTKRFAAGGTPAVDDVTFEAPAGKITALIGPSGAGKSTILRAVAGLESPDAGTVEVEGADVTRVPVQHRKVGVVFQGYALFNNMSVWKNIAFGLEVRGRPSAEVRARVDALLDLVQLGDLRARMPAQLSGGQRQRVAFARALATEPKVLLLDEPFGALDARVRVELREWLQRLHERTHVTTILVTHDQDEALELAAHVVVMLGGRVAQTGTPEDVYDRPATAPVASFLGASLMRGRVAVEGEADVVDAWVRPHDVKLRRADHDNGHGTSSSSSADVRVGRIERVKIVAARAKVALVLVGGERVTVDISRAEIEELAVGEGDHVLIDVQQARVFREDYAI